MECRRSLPPPSIRCQAAGSGSGVHGYKEYRQVELLFMKLQEMLLNVVEGSRKSVYVVIQPPPQMSLAWSCPLGGIEGRLRQNANESAVVHATPSPIHANWV